MVDIGLVGVGSWGRFILRDLLSLDCRVHAVARSPESRTRASEAASIVSSIDELPDVAGIIVATPSITHAQVVEGTLPRGIPVFVEKPFTTDAKSAKRLLAKGAPRLFVMDKWRYHGAVLRLAQIAKDRVLGKVLGLQTQRTSWGLIHEDASTIWHLMPHELAIALEIFGHLPEPRFARMTSVPAGGDVGMITGLGRAPWMMSEISSRESSRGRSIKLLCEEGIAVMDHSYTDHIKIYSGNGTEPEMPEPKSVPVSMEMPLLKELRAFVEYLRGGPAPKSSAQEGVAIVQTIEKLLHLAR